MNDNKRIAVNTVVLYMKLVITIVINFIVLRLVLEALGVSEYGLYNVVGGIVSMLNILGASMVATSYRYMAVEIGKGEIGNPNKVYNMVLVIHLLLAFLLIIVGETLGVFYVNNYLNVDTDKIPDALFVLHLSLLTSAFAVITVPTNGLIIAREKFLFTSIVESVSAILMLVLIILLMTMEGNRLRYYAVFLAFIQFLQPLSYQIYCYSKDYSIVRWNFSRTLSDYTNIVKFTWWILLGAVAVVGKMQGAAMIINFFFGTVLNAAYGLASQVNRAVVQFTSTLRQAAIPQIMKSKGAGDDDRSLLLVYAISRYSYLCMNVITIPLLLCLDDVLKIWLDTPPKFTQTFIVFMLINGMISNLGSGFDAYIQATGKIRKNQIGFCLINLSLLPTIFILYKLGMPPYINVVVMVVLAAVTLVFQVYIMIELTAFKMSEYVRHTIVPSLLSTAVALLPLVLVRMLFGHSLIATTTFVIVAVLWTFASIYICGISKREREIITGIIRNKLLHKKLFRYGNL